MRNRYSKIQYGLINNNPIIPIHFLSLNFNKHLKHKDNSILNKFYLTYIDSTEVMCANCNIKYSGSHCYQSVVNHINQNCYDSCFFYMYNNDKIYFDIATKYPILKSRLDAFPSQLFFLCNNNEHYIYLFIYLFRFI